jgi:hypothetical protein
VNKLNEYQALNSMFVLGIVTLLFTLSLQSPLSPISNVSASFGANSGYHLGIDSVTLFNDTEIEIAEFTPDIYTHIVYTGETLNTITLYLNISILEEPHISPSYNFLEFSSWNRISGELIDPNGHNTNLSYASLLYENDYSNYYILVYSFTDLNYNLRYTGEYSVLIKWDIITEVP